MNTNSNFKGGTKNGGRSSIYSVSHLLGHSSIKTTEKYLHSDMAKLKVDVSNLSLDRKVIKLDDAVTNKALGKN